MAFMIAVLFLQFIFTRSCPVEERNALLEMVADSSSSFLKNSWVGEDCCKWKRVNCEAQTSRVRSIFFDVDFSDFKSHEILNQLCELRQLKSLSFYMTEPWVAEIPSCLHNLTLLEKLEVSYNYNSKAYISDITHPVNKLRHLKKLVITNSGLTLESLERITNLQSLEYLELGFNELGGNIPVSLCSLTKLTYLSLASNKLRGQIPSCLSFLKSLEVLDLSENMLSGNIPSFSLPNLTSVELYANQLRGDVPCFNATVKLLSLQKNSLSGSFPNCLCKLTKIDISDNQLSSHLPTCTNNSSIKVLQLSGNKLSGPIPSSLFSNTALQYLDLSSNQFTGLILNLYRNGSAIRTLRLADNRLTGDLSSIDWNILCRRLLYLDVSQNGITGVLPESIGNCSKLVLLIMNQNQLEGYIPSRFGELRALRGLLLSGNRLTGPLPESLGNCSELKVLDISDNSFYGYLPSEIYNLENLRIFSLASNHFTGNLPASNGSPSLLQIMDISNNSFTGRLPKLLRFQKAKPGFDNDVLEVLRGRLIVPQFKLKASAKGQELPYQVTDLLVYIDASNNQFEGEIPTEWSNFSSLVFLTLSSNNLSGEIPEALGNLQSLQSLDLSYNKITGRIPETLTSLTKLSFFNVSYNNLTGAIPQGSQFNTFSNMSYIGNSDLCGFPLHSCFTQQLPLSRVTTLKKLTVLVLIVPVILTIIFCLILIVSRNKKQHNGCHFGSLEAELWTATNGYSSSNIIGQGGCSTVYKGTLNDKGLVAIKVFQPEKLGEFLREQNILSNIQHRNLVKVFGSCSNQEFNALIMQYMPNGSLEKQLHELMGVNLSWEMRLKIAVGVGNAMVYLHGETGEPEPIVHRDLKPSNIFLDKDMEAHVGDFGIAMRLSSSTSAAVCFSQFAGSPGYMAPEYGTMGQITRAVDVYSYGILVLEILTRKRPTSILFDDGRSNIRSWISSGYPDNIESVIDPILCKEMQSTPMIIEKVNMLTRMAILCCSPHPEDRPTMKDVITFISERSRTLRFSECGRCFTHPSNRILLG